MTEQDNRNPGQLPPEDQFRLEQLSAWASAVPTGRRKLFVVSTIVMVAVFGIGGVWASTAPLGGAVVGSGRVQALGNNRVAQHLEGGIIKEIKVKEGDRVEQGQVLATLDTTAVASQLIATKIQMATLVIELERWRAAGQGAKSFSVDFNKLGDVGGVGRVMEALQSQKAEFDSMYDLVQKQLSILDSRTASEKEDISSYKSQLVSLNKQYDLIDQEYKSLASLLDKGLTSASRVLALQRNMADIDAKREIAAFSISKSESNIKTNGEEKEKLALQYRGQASEGFTRVQRELNRLDDIEARLSDQMRRSEIRSPASGVVFRIPLKTEGAVLRPGEAFAEVFPNGAGLAVDTVVLPKDIGEVSLGQDVDVVFQSEHRTTLAPVRGTVNYIATDTTVSETTGQATYFVRVAIDSAESPDRIVPGNTAEVFFRTQPKTLVQMIVEPITKFAFRSFTG